MLAFGFNCDIKLEHHLDIKDNIVHTFAIRRSIREMESLTGMMLMQ